jgi:gliding motility-associated-like protein
VFADTTQSILYTYTDTGHYTIVLTIKDSHSCLYTKTQNNYVTVAHPYPAFVAAPLLGCAPLFTTFTDQSTDVSGMAINTHYWDFGDGTNVTVTTPTVTHTYNTGGIFNVKLVVTDNAGCKDSLTKPNYINAYKPSPLFFANDTSVCIGENILFTVQSLSAGTTAVWYFGDGTTSTSLSPTHAYSSLGSFTVKLVVTDIHGCKDSLTKTPYINVGKPHASFTMTDSFSICPPLLDTFINTSTGAVSYNWSLGGGNTSTLTNPNNLYTSIGLDTIRLIAISTDGCPDTAYGHVGIFGYAGGFSYYPLSGCAPLLVNFNANYINVPKILWDFSDGNIDSATGVASTSHIYYNPGAYVPKLILNDGNGCQNSSIGLDTIKVGGLIADFTFSPPCVNALIQFHDSSTSFFSPLATDKWFFDDGQTTTSSNPTHLYDSAGVYHITLVVTNDSGCVDTLKGSITIYNLPIISAGADTSICLHDTMHLHATGGTTYVWSPAIGLSCTSCTNPIANPLIATTYIVTGTDIRGCVNTDTVKINLQTKTTSMVDSGRTICPRDSLQLFAYGAQKYLWIPSAGLNNDHIPNPKASPTNPTNYMVIGWEGTCIPDTNYVSLLLHPNPSVNAGSDQIIIEGSGVTLQATGINIVTYTWDIAPFMSCNICSDPTVSPTVTTTYTVSGRTKEGCIDSDAVVVRVLCDKSQVFIPNTFTPNGDGQNDVFYPRGKGIKMVNSFRVYDRWGEMIFERKMIQLNDDQNAWDGKFKGATLNPDVYVYVMDAVCESGEELTLKGDVTIIR